MSPDDPRHGTLNAYKNLRCRCTACTAAECRYEKRRKWLVHQGLNLSLPAIGFQRRVHALMAIGWTQKSIAEGLGIATGNLSVKMRANSLVYRATHVSMCELYEARCMKPQRGMVNARTARIAAKRGWLPPLAWDDIDDPNERPTAITRDGSWEDQVDHAIVWRVVNEQTRPRKLTRAESAEVARVLLSRGVSTFVIENDYGIKAERYKEAVA